MLTAIANAHRSQLPRPGEIVTVRLDRCTFHVKHKQRTIAPRRRRFIVESYPLSDAADQRYSRGIHTCTLRALDNGERVRIAGHWCDDV